MSRLTDYIQEISGITFDETADHTHGNGGQVIVLRPGAQVAPHGAGEGGGSSGNAPIPGQAGSLTDTSVSFAEGELPPGGFWTQSPDGNQLVYVVPQLTPDGQATTSALVFKPTQVGPSGEIRFTGSSDAIARYEAVPAPTGPAVNPSTIGSLAELKALADDPTVQGIAQTGPTTWTVWLPLQGVSVNYDVQPDGTLKKGFTDNTPPPIPAGAIVGTGQDAAPLAAPGLSGLGGVNAIRGENSTAFNQLSSNLRNLAEGNDPLAATTAPLDPVSQQQALTRFLVDPSGTSAGLSPNTSLGDIGLTLGATPANATEAAARLRLQGQQVQNPSGDPLVRSRDQSVLDAFGVQSTGDPLADAELVANLRAAQQSRLPAAGGDPITAARLAVQGSGLPVPVNLGGIAR